MSQSQTETPTESRSERERGGGCTCVILFALLLILFAAGYMCLGTGDILSTTGDGSSTNQATPDDQQAGTTGDGQEGTPSSSTAPSDSQPGGPGETADNPPTQESAPTPQETPTQFDGTSQAINDRSAATFQAAQSCADEIGYPISVNDHWDVWELIFYTIYFSEQSDNLPPTCTQFAEEYNQSGLGDFIHAMGGHWWESSLEGSTTDQASCPNLEDCARSCTTTLGLDPERYSYFELAEYLSKNYADTRSRPADCLAFQSRFLQQEAYNLVENPTAAPVCDGNSMPSALCPQARDLDAANSCAEKLGWDGDLNGDNGLNQLSDYVTDQFSLSYGDIPNECYQFMHTEALAQTARQTALENINAAAACINNVADCRALPGFGEISQSAVTCAVEVGWNSAIETPDDLGEFFEYLLITAPWLESGVLPQTCLDFLNSTSPAALNAEYWQLLASVLSQSEEIER